jgi:hypothetical protein
MNKSFSLKEFALAFVTPLPARDWFVILCLTLLLFIGCVSYAGYLFIGIRGGTIIGSAQSDRPVLPKVSRADLTKILDTYRVRKANYEARNFPRPTLTNPSK